MIFFDSVRWWVFAEDPGNSSIGRIYTSSDVRVASSWSEHPFSTELPPMAALGLYVWFFGDVEMRHVPQRF